MNDQEIEQEIQTKGKTAARVTPADIEANIASEHYFTARDGAMGMYPSLDSLKECPLELGLLTFCVLILRNGFTVTGESACASPENFDAEIGRKIARQNALQKIWPLMGYALKQLLLQAANQPPAVGAAHSGYSMMLPHQQRVVDEKVELEARLGKLVAFTRTPTFEGLDEAERNRLDQQAACMAMYSTILTDRIAAFTPAAAGRSA